MNTKKKKWSSAVLREIKRELSASFSELRSLKVRNYYADGRIVAFAKTPNKKRIYVRDTSPQAVISKFYKSAIELTGASQV